MARQPFVRKECECGHSDQNHVPTCRYCICVAFVLNINAQESAPAATEGKPPSRRRDE